MRPLSPLSTIGIIGGGQLGRMLCVAAAKLGYRTHIFATSQNCPAAQLANVCTVGTTKDHNVFQKFAHDVDVITFEFENIERAPFDAIKGLCPIHPSPEILATTRDRAREKQFLNEHGIKTAHWHLFKNAPSLEEAQTLDYPLIVKTTRDGYDGKGQKRVTNAQELIAAYHELTPHPVIAEEIIPFSCELSVMVIRAADGQVRCFDATENHHKNGILDVSLAPAPRTVEIRQAAQEMAVTIAQATELIGIMGVEFFLDGRGILRVNELAPRPHNSGHWTMDGCAYDQFDMHIRAVAGLPLPQPVRSHDVIMQNLIGPQSFACFRRALSYQGYIPYLYGKKEAKKGRKMGHVNIPLAYDSLPGALGIADILSPLDI